MTPELETAVDAAIQAGRFLRQHASGPKVVDAASRHDLKLRLDVESQALIEKILLSRFPKHALYGEEGIAGRTASSDQWIVDPIDGTVNFFYGIPHYCVSIALRSEGRLRLGVIHDPSMDETWTAEADGPALLNGEPVRVSDRCELSESVVTVGFSRTAGAGEEGLEQFRRVSRGVRKCRMMGSAALGLAYIASGRLDAYVEGEIRLWDIAAGQLIVERAGGRVDLRPASVEDQFGILASNGQVHEAVDQLWKLSS